MLLYLYRYLLFLELENLLGFVYCFLIIIQNILTLCYRHGRAQISSILLEEGKSALLVTQSVANYYCIFKDNFKI